MGIIDGAGDGNFYPAGKLTGYAFAKMLLTAIGYDSQIEGFTGNSWSINVATIGMEVGLHDGLEKMFGSAELSRQEAAQMALNAIKTPLVTYEKQATITVNGAEVAVGSTEAQYVTTTLAKEQRISDQRLTNASSTAPNYTVEFGEKYFPKLRLVGESDGFERPSHTWVYENKELGTYPDNDILVETYTEGVSCNTLFDLLGRSNLEDYSFDYYVDGVANTKANAKTILTRSTDDFSATDNGVLTQVFVDHEANNGKGAIIITSIHTYLAQATTDYNKTRETATLKVFDNYDATPGKEQSHSVTKTIDVDDVPETVDLKADQFVLVNWTGKDRDDGKYDVVVIDDVEILSDVAITKFSKNSDTESDSDTVRACFKKLTTGGTEYKGSAAAVYSDEVLDLYANNLLTGKTCNVYLDKYGFAIGVDLHTGNDNYVFIAGYDLNGSNIAGGNARANAIFLDGTAQAIEVNIKDTNKNIDKFVGGTSDSKGYYEEWADPATTGKAYSHNRWYTYTENKGVYTLNPADRMFTTEVAKGATTPALASLTIKCNNVRLTEDPSAGTKNSKHPTVEAAAGRRAYGNDDSIYIIADMDTVSMSANDRDLPGKVIVDVDGFYTGVQNVEIDVFAASAVAAKVTDNKDGTTGGSHEEYAAYDSVYTLYDKNNFIIASVIIGDAKGGDSNLAYIKSAALSEEIIDDTYYWTFEAILDGTIQELTVKSKFANTIKELDVSEVMELRYDGEYVSKIIDLDLSDFYTEGDYTTQNIDDEKVYDVSGLSVAGANKADDLHLEGNTMYLTSNHDDYGLTFVKDAKAVVHQQVNGKWKWQEYDTVSDAIDALGDADKSDSNGKLGFDGRITAVLNSNGVAKWVVIDSNTDVVTSTTTGGSDSGVYVHDDGDGYLSLTSTKNLTAPQIRNAILDFFNDSDIVSANYNAKTKTVTIVYGDGSEDEYGVRLNKVSSAEDVEAAELMNKVQDKIESTYGEITVEGNKMTATGSSADYVDPDEGENGTSQATLDFVNFVVALHANGASEIEFDGVTYKWNKDLRHASKWLKDGGTVDENGDAETAADTLVTAVVTDVTDQASGDTLGTGEVATIIITVDDNPMVFVIKIPAAS